MGEDWGQSARLIEDIPQSEDKVLKEGGLYTSVSN